MLYYWIDEHFTFHVDRVKLDNDADEQYADCYSTVYGNHVIDVNDSSIAIYEWTLKLLSSLEMNPICIGIDASNDQVITGDFTNPTHSTHYYGVSRNGFLYDFNVPIWDSREVFDSMEDGDCITLLLDVTQCALYCQVNDGMRLVIAANIDFDDDEYNFAVAICTQDDTREEIQLIDFEIIHCQ